MIALFSLLTIIILSAIAVRIGGIALELTGLSHDIASFQAMSAFSGAGFTTSESEAIVTHPVRRRIIRILILMGSAGITTSIATLVLTFVGQAGRQVLEKGLILLLGLAVISLLSMSKLIYRLMRDAIGKALARWTRAHIFDYEQLLGFSEGYCIYRILVRGDSWLRDKRLDELKLEQKGVLILAIYRKEGKKEKFIGSLTGETVIQVSDILICYSSKDIGEDFFR